MPLNLKKAPKGTGGGNTPPLEEGTYPARVVQIVDLGLQNQRPWQGQEKAPAYEMSITYELLDEFMLDEDGKELEDKPRWLSEIIPVHNLSADKAKSTKRYMALDAGCEYDGDFTKLINTPCMVTIVNNQGKGANTGKVFNNVASIAPMRSKDAAKAAELVNEPKLFVLDEPDLDVYEKLPDFMKEKLTGNLEYEGSALQAALGEEPQDKEESESNDEDW